VFFEAQQGQRGHHLGAGERRRQRWVVKVREEIGCRLYTIRLSFREYSTDVLFLKATEGDVKGLTGGYSMEH
jgi:hypothetical protein